VPARQEPAKKDTSSVLSFLQHAQDNVARSRAGIARPGALPVVSGGVAVPGAVMAEMVTPWQALCNSLHNVTPANAADLEKEIVASLPKLEPRQATELVVKSHAADPLRNASLLDELTRALVVPIPRFRSSDLTRLAEAFCSWTLSISSAGDDNRVRLSEAVKNYFNGLYAEVSLRLMDMALGDLARVAQVFATVGVGGTKLFASIARASGARMDRFTPGELVTLVTAFEKEGCFQTALYEGLARCLKANVRDVTPKDILRAMVSLASCGIRDEGLALAIGDHLPKTAIAGGAFTMEESVTLAWTFCVLDLHHDELFRAVFAKMEDSPLQESQTLCQLYEIHLTLSKFHGTSYKDYELDDETVQSLRTHYRKNYVKVKPARSSERLHADIADALQQVVDASVATAYSTSLGPMVDIAAVASKSRRSSSSSMPVVAIDIDGPHSLIRSMDPLENSAVAGPATRVRGEVGFRRRLLQKCGMTMVVFSEDKWRGLDGSRDRREFLRRVLRGAGVSRDRLL